MAAIPMLDEDECYLAAILDDSSGVELAEFVWIDEEQPDGCFRLWDYQWSWYRNEETFQIDWCVAEDSVVMTSRGQVPIQHVEVGDLVLTHEGRWKPVVKTHDRGQRDVVSVRGGGNQVGLRVTPEHELYVRRHRRKTAFESARWAAAGELMTTSPTSRDRHDRWATPAIIETLPLPEIIQRYAPGRRNDLTVEHLDMGDFWWLVGLYVAEGSLSSSYGRGGTVNRSTFSLHNDEVAKVGAILDGLGFRYAINASAKALTTDLIVNSITLATYLADLAGRGSRFKTLHPAIFSHPQRAAVLDGMIFGDGHERQGRVEYSTSSKRLAHDARTLATSLGWQASVTTSVRAETEIRGRILRSARRYSVSMCERPRRARVVFEGEHAWSAVTDVEPAGRARVYDLTVQDDSSFIADGQVVSNCGRAVGKSVGIQMRAFAFPFCHAGQEMLITAPELNHLRPVTDKVEHLFRSTRLGSAMLPTGRGQGINHSPQFQAHFLNNARIISRLPNRDGRGVKGMHPLVIEMDEGQDYPDNGWIELIETMKHGIEGAQWRVHGVSRGVRDRYYKYTMGEDPDMPFYVHRFMAMHRPTWGALERKQKIAIYGGTSDNVDYRRNIYGDHGDATNPVFVLARLMACVRINESPWASEYNDTIYKRIKIEHELLQSMGSVEPLLDSIPAIHLDEQYTSYWGGMDVGYTRDPSELLIFGALKHPKQKGEEMLRLLLRVHLMRIGAADQAEAVRFVMRFYGDRLKAFAMDKSGNGLPLWQELDPEATGTSAALRRTPEHLVRKIRGYGFSNKVAVEFDDRELVGRETERDAIIEKNVVDFATDEMRKMVDQGRYELPYDRELLTEFQGQEIQYQRDEGSAAGLKTRRYGGGSFHCVDPETEILTGRGWKRYDQISVGDEALTLSMATGSSRWGLIDDISIFDGPSELVSMESARHSSLTTENHRWPTRTYHSRNLTHGDLHYRTTSELSAGSSILMTAPHDDFPDTPVHSDEMVELVAWYWTEGHASGSNTSITQSQRVHPEHCDRIRRALIAEFGPPGNALSGPGSSRTRNYSNEGSWSEHVDARDKAMWQLRVDAGRVLRGLAPDRIPAMGFLRSLTKAQLHLFLSISELGDGNHSPNSTRRAFQHLRDEGQNRMLEIVCALAGVATSTHVYERATSRSGVSVTTNLLEGVHVRPGKFRTRVPYEGVVWCPSTADGNWLARRNGKIYWTGNTLDATKMMQAAKSLQVMEAALRVDKQEPVLARFG